MCACLAGDHNLFAIQVRYWTIVIKFSGHDILIAAFRFGMSYSTSTEVVRACRIEMSTGALSHHKVVYFESQTYAGAEEQKGVSKAQSFLPVESIFQQQQG